MPPIALLAWRSTLWLILSIEVLILAGVAGWMRRFKECQPDRELGCFVSSTPIVLGAIAVIALVALALFFGRARRLRADVQLASGFVALAAMRVLFEAFASVLTVHHQTLYQMGAVLLGVVLGEAYAWAIGATRDDEPQRAWWRRASYGLEGGLAIFAATYLSAATSKLRFGGMEWLSSSTIRMMAISHVEVGSESLPDALGRFVAESPRIASALEVATIVVQLGAVLLVVPRLRRLAAAAIAAFHIGIWATSHILFVQPLVLAVVLATPWDRIARALGRDVSRDEAALAGALAWAPVSVRRGAAVWTAIALATVATLGVIAPHATLASARALGGFLVPAQGHDDPEPPPAPRDVIAVLDGLAVGNEIEGWTVSEIGAPHDRRIAIELTRDEHRFRAVLAPPDAVPFEPPFRTERYVLLYEPARMASDELAAERDRVLAALRDRIARAERSVPILRGL
ncbi:Hypothetical protein I5071_64470 [Sandaracinus amylolyticus]|nr:Hypothetical protein I5071_64470 [Sandaracinus amylolyticus]